MFFLERILTPEERIRRAESLYYKKKMQNAGVRVTSTRNIGKIEKKDFGLLKRMILQILICLGIYFIFYLIQNSNYIFSEDVLNKTREILSTDINFSALYEQGSQWIEQIKSKIENKKEEQQEAEEIQNNEQNTEQQQEQNPITEENIGGASEEVNVEEVQEGEETEQLSQMELDAKEIKEKYTLIYPLKGTITSRFGLRNPTTPTVPKNHTGIDIAAETGTVILAALDGRVEIASSEGDYGNHLKIVKDDVAIVYAHCNKLYVNQGDYINQGDAIAEVGATGNVTGPHLHFEIRKQERYVDPDLIMTF